MTSLYTTFARTAKRFTRSSGVPPAEDQTIPTATSCWRGETGCQPPRDKVLTAARLCLADAVLAPARWLFSLLHREVTALAGRAKAVLPLAATAASTPSKAGRRQQLFSDLLLLSTVATGSVELTSSTNALRCRRRGQALCSLFSSVGFSVTLRRCHFHVFRGNVFPVSLPAVEDGI